ncbi:MAG TPA: hypothetical protein VGN63_01715 [Flavisolibacter sp.]|jgi:hypothetical protein|nr:hypothetical protein [Flavisolibacter sp.]
MVTTQLHWKDCQAAPVEAGVTLLSINYYPLTTHHSQPAIVRQP